MQVMQKFMQIASLTAVALVGITSAIPALPQLSPQALRAYEAGQQVRRSLLESRQNPQTGLPDGLTDVDILEFALTLENLEASFYQQGFARFPDSDFAALGLNQADILNLKSISTIEATHVTTLSAAIAGTGAAPVQPCIYDFKFSDAASMVSTASILESVGVSAYLAAAPLVKSPAILTVAAEIVTVEARHQTFIRTASKAVAIPGPFDTPLGIRGVFSIAATFIKSCPSGSSLAITPFPPLTMSPSQAPGKMVGGSEVRMDSSAAANAVSCAFVNGGQPGGAAFAPFKNGACVLPMGLNGITYVHLANSIPKDGVLSDAIVLAGPLVVVID
ncbi:BgTH12-04352 [Blumeria graminis f. sp. triticale]|nr:BgTH12-04352 [Blumeria graminis f. sp. triticale]